MKKLAGAHLSLDVVGGRTQFSAVSALSDRVPTLRTLDELWEIFGSGRLIYGSNWPVSERMAPYRVGLKVVQEYFAARGAVAADAYFWRNSAAAYKWIKRT